MQSPGFADPATGYKKFINDDSFIDYLILNELSKNVDAYRLSTYMYKDDMFHGGKISIGPMWDYDLAWHNCNFGNTSSPLYWQHEQTNDQYPIPTWWTKLMQDPNFKDKLYCRYHTLRQGILSNAELFEYIDKTVLQLNEAQKRNYQQFPILGAYIYPNPQSQVGATYVTEINDLKQWIINRGSWMDIHMPGFCTDIGITEQEDLERTVTVYPNPFSSSVTIDLKLLPNATIGSIQLIDVLGKILSIKAETYINNKLEISTSLLNPGTYFLLVEINGKTLQKKIIKMNHL